MMMAVRVKRRRNPEFITKLVWEVRIKSIYEEEFFNVCKFTTNNAVQKGM